MSSDREEGELYSDDDCKIIEISTDDNVEAAEVPAPALKPLEITLSARQSEDMDISPIASDKPWDNNEQGGYVFEVDSPLDSSVNSPAEPILQPTAAVELTVQPTLPVESVAQPSFVVESVSRSKTPTPSPALQPPTASVKKKKRFSQRFLGRLRSFLLSGMDDFTSSSESDSETEDVYQQLRDQLDFHHREHQDALKKKAKLIKDLEACELVINHHNECIGNLLSDISMRSNDLVRRFKSKNRRNKRRAFNIQHDFESRVEDMLFQMSNMNQPSPENVSPTENNWKKMQDKPDVEPPIIDKPVDKVDSAKSVKPASIPPREKKKRRASNLLSKEEELRQKLVSKKSRGLVADSETNGNVRNTTAVEAVEVSIASPTRPRVLSAPVSPIKVVNPSFTTKAVLPAFNIQSKEDVTEKENSTLFKGPLMYFRSFILDPMYPIKESLKQLRTRINPESPLCYYELLGFCIDQTCPDQHLRDNQLSDQQLLEEILSFIPGIAKEDFGRQAASLLKEKPLEQIVEDLRQEVAGQSFINLAVSRV